MKCQNLFSGKNKKDIINLSSAELAQTLVKVKKELINIHGNAIILLLFSWFAHVLSIFICCKCFLENKHMF